MVAVGNTRAVVAGKFTTMTAELLALRDLVMACGHGQLSVRVAGPGGRRNRAWSGLVTSRSAESTAPVHGRLESLYRAVGVSLFGVGGGTTVRAGAVAIQSAIAARPTEP